MSDGDVLLKAILIDPADDVARLAYADWLEEEGRARGEYVRAAVAIDRGPAVADSSNNGEPLPMTARHVPTVTGITGMVAHDLRNRSRCAGRWYHRGFVWRVALPCAAFKDHAEALFAHHPITEVVLTDRSVGWGREKPPKRHAYMRGEDDGTAPAPFMIPPAIFDLLDRFGGVKDGNPHLEDWLHWPRQEAAERALSDACVAYGRTLAGLPALEVAR